MLTPENNVDQARRGRGISLSSRPPRMGDGVRYGHQAGVAQRRISPISASAGGSMVLDLRLCI